MKEPTSIETDARPSSVQLISPPSSESRFEGVAFSQSGHILGVVDPDRNTVFLFRRNATGQFDDQPYCVIDGSQSELTYPHDVSFSRFGGSEVLAVGQRTGAIAIYEKNRSNDDYGPAPVFAIHGPETGLDFSDGVAFIPPTYQHVAACNLLLGTISVYKRIPSLAIGFQLEPAFELRHPSIVHPDGLCFSSCGKWLAVANHANNTISIFKRHGDRLLRRSGFEYGPDPVAVIDDPELRHPHSVAFIPKSHHVVVTSAGANFFNVYQHDGKARWSHSPMVQQAVGLEDDFRKVNLENNKEGGPKGVAVHKSTIAVCNPVFGVKIYSFRETRRRN